MKKNEEAAAKAKPKTTAAQIRVQKGESSEDEDGVIGLRRGMAEMRIKTRIGEELCRNVGDGPRRAERSARCSDVWLKSKQLLSSERTSIFVLAADG